MPIHDLDINSKNAIRSIINEFTPGDYITFNGLADKLKELGANGDTTKKAQGLGQRIGNAIKAKGEDAVNLKIDYAKVIEYPTLDGTRMVEDRPILHPWRDTDGNAIVYLRQVGRVGDL